MACVGNQLSLEHGTGDPGRNEYCTSYIWIYHRCPHSHYGGDSTLYRIRLKRLCFFYCFGMAWVGQPNIFNSPFITNLAIKGRRRALCKSKQSSKLILNYTEPSFSEYLQLRSPFRLLSNTSPVRQFEISIPSA